MKLTKVQELEEKLKMQEETICMMTTVLEGVMTVLDGYSERLKVLETNAGLHTWSKKEEE